MWFIEKTVWKEIMWLYKSYVLNGIYYHFITGAMFKYHKKPKKRMLKQCQVSTKSKNK